MAKIDDLLKILQSQELDRHWERLNPRKSIGNKILIDTERVGFIFDSSGEKFLGIINWK